MSSPSDWPRVKSVLAGALACDSRDRGAYVRDACAGDAALLAQIEALLAETDRVEAFLETPAALVLDEGRRLGDLTGRAIGTYRVLSPLGSGGMGEVYLAHDDKLD